MLCSMAHIESIEGYLRAQVAERRAAEQKALRPREQPFVTISRQAGAGGHSLAKAMIEVFERQDDSELFTGWQIFDQKLCEIVARDPRYERSMNSLLTEKYRTRTNEFFHQIFQSTIDQDIVMDQVFRVVRALASIGKAIIVGRAGSEVTRDMRFGIAIRLVAAEDVRIPRVMRTYDLDERRARDEARKIDSHRARLLKQHFGVDINDPTHYDVTWNTGTVPFETIAEATAAAIRHRVRSAEIRS